MEGSGGCFLYSCVHARTCTCYLKHKYVKKLPRSQSREGETSLLPLIRPLRQHVVILLSVGAQGQELWRGRRRAFRLIQTFL